eukprot:TRINITY_DN32539_c0_g1_i1.p1 TRINITY_DN32539_c0_g1~~TRINITY_DN32539_c0_g1_i1.p1  ORF type:complete len:240 (+),score=64.39 TRINITY_DN32539_c0_g1_i1:152-871(+)
MLKVAVFTALFLQTFAHPVAQFDPNDDAEVFSGPINSNAGDYDDYDYFGTFVPRVRVFVIPVSGPSDSDEYYDYPDVVQQRPSFDSLFSIIKSMLAPRTFVPTNTTAPSSSNDDCFLCSIFQDSFDSVQDHIDSVRDKENEVFDDSTADDEALDVNNSTHTTKVLDDGSVVHINKTTIADTDEDGNSFFFHRAVIHNFGTPDDTPDVVDDSIDDSQDPEIDETVTDLEETGVDAGLLEV